MQHPFSHTCMFEPCLINKENDQFRQACLATQSILLTGEFSTISSYVIMSSVLFSFDIRNRKNIVTVPEGFYGSLFNFNRAGKNIYLVCQPSKSSFNLILILASHQNRWQSSLASVNYSQFIYTFPPQITSSNLTESSRLLVYGT